MAKGKVFLMQIILIFLSLKLKLYLTITLKAKRLLVKISNSSTNYFIDTFNFTYLDENTRDIYERAKYKRRIDYIIKIILVGEMEFKNNFIYEHSFNYADYPYFFQLFN